MSEIICTHSITLDFTLWFPQAPLHCHDITFLIADMYMPVPVLLGKSFLHLFGIDIVTQLADCATQRKKEADTVSSLVSSSPSEPVSSSVRPEFADSFLPKENEPNEYETRSFTEFDFDADNAETYEMFSSNQTIQEALEDMLKRANDQGLPEKYQSSMKTLVYKYDIWRTTIGADPPARVPPLKLRVKDKAPPVHAGTRRYPPLYRQFMNKRLTELEKMGLVYRNQQSRYSSAVHVVPKVTPATDIDTDFRWTVDLRQVNKLFEPIS